ncbi:hypothetical protein TNCV_5110371 [Trichonephila clavipes]|nr:hypothetical protein TNCV_5110371 [Trichonephila clavipes]
MDVELRRKWASEFFRELISSVNPEMLPIHDKTMEVTREVNRENMEATGEINRENMEATREMDEIMGATREITRENVEATWEMDETMVATREINRENMEATREINRENMEPTREMDETMEVGENQMVDGGNSIAVGEDQNDMAGRENSIAAGEGQNVMTAGENDAGWENLFQLVNESILKGYFNFNNEQDLGESFTELPQTIHITRSINPRIMVGVPDE